MGEWKGERVKGREGGREREGEREASQTGWLGKEERIEKKEKRRQREYREI